MAWPVVTGTCAYPLESTTWLAALQVVTDRCGGDPGRLAAMGDEAFTVLVRDAQRGWGGQKAWGTICRRVFAALTDTEGVVVSAVGGCCGGAPTNWVTCSAPAASCGRWRRTWSRCWLSSACPGWVMSLG